jgi:hypothetical protein
MQEVTFVIGLPGSGKSVLVDYYRIHPCIDYKIYDDWGECVLDGYNSETFESECRYQNLISDLNENIPCFISCIKFCEDKFLESFISHLTQKFPNIKVNRIYFENNFINCKINITYRDFKRGGYWEETTPNNFLYIGEIINEKPRYRMEIKNAENLSKIYTPKEGYPIIPIVSSLDFFLHK